MLAGDRSARAHASFHDLPTCLPYIFNVRAAPQIETDQWVKIAVAGVKYIREHQIVFRADAISFGEHFGQARTRHHCILNHHFRHQAAHRSECSLTRGPKFPSLLFISRTFD